MCVDMRVCTPRLRLRTFGIALPGRPPAPFPRSPELTLENRSNEAYFRFPALCRPESSGHRLDFLFVIAISFDAAALFSMGIFRLDSNSEHQSGGSFDRFPRRVSQSRNPIQARKRASDLRLNPPGRTDDFLREEKVMTQWMQRNQCVFF
jgi:hypothetical protein